jgi:hypothetical protein
VVALHQPLDRTAPGYPVAAQHIREGNTTEEISARLRRAARTIERKLDLIGPRWTA